MRVVLAIISLLAVAACGGADSFNPAPQIEVQRRAYVHDGPALMTLYTIINDENGEGAHTALLINGSQRVMWDPAGSFRHPFVPEQGDLHYGITENIRKAYIDYHVRERFHMITQTVEITSQQANMLIAEAAANGSAPRATCANSTSRILREAGFDVSRTWFPKALMDDFGRLPGATTRKIDITNVDTSHTVNFGESPTPLPVY